MGGGRRIWHVKKLNSRTKVYPKYHLTKLFLGIFRFLVVKSKKSFTCILQFQFVKKCHIFPWSKFLIFYDRNSAKGWARRINWGIDQSNRESRCSSYGEEEGTNYQRSFKDYFSHYSSFLSLECACNLILMPESEEHEFGIQRLINENLSGPEFFKKTTLW